MYKMLIISLVFVCGLSSFTTVRNNPNIEKFLNEFVANKECSKISLNGNLFSFKNKDEVKSEIEVFQLYIFKEEAPLSKSDQKYLSKEIRNSGLEILNMIKSKGSNIEIYVKEHDDIIENVVLLVYEEDSSIVFHAKGKISYSDLKNLNIDFEGSEVFDEY